MQTRRARGLAMGCLAMLVGSLAAREGHGQQAQSVALGALTVRGPLGRPPVQQVLERSLEAYQRCVAERTGQRLSGELEVRVHVEANGVPIAASVDRSNVGDRALERCVVAVTEGWQLAERPAATQVTFTLRVGQGQPSGEDRDVEAVIALGEGEDGHLPASARNTAPGRRAAVQRRAWTAVEGGMHVQGGLTEARVTRVLRGRSGLLRRCVSATPVSSGTPVPWEVLVTLRVATNGQVDQEPVVQVNGAPPSVTACVAAVLRETRFPAAPSGTQVVARYRAVPRT